MGLFLVQNGRDTWHYPLSGGIQRGDSIEKAIKRKVFE